MFVYSFEKLVFWNDLRGFITEIYKITNNYPKAENYCLIDQIRRASISVSSNLSEGSSRLSRKDQAHFYQIAFSSLMEVLSQLIVSLDLNYIDYETYSRLRKKVDYLAQKIIALRKSRLENIS